MEFYTKTIERIYEPDVLVCGLGPAGISAAVASARMGALTMAVERCAFAGGNFTNAKVVGIIGAVNSFTGALVTGGITFEMLKRAAYRREDDYSRKPLCDLFEENRDSAGQVYQPKTTKNHVEQVNSVRLLFDPEIFKRQADMLLTGSVVKLLYHTVIADTVMADGHILDTLVKGLAEPLATLPKYVAGIGMYVSQLITEFFISSGSGQAAAVMPILTPLADVIGITRQTAVLALQYGDGIPNILFPTSGYFMAGLAMAKVPYQRWLKFVWPLVAIQLVLCAVFITIAVAINLGPF